MISRRSLLVAPAAAILAGCQNSPTPSSPPPPAGNTPAPAAGMKIGLLTNGSLTDSGWNSLAGQGLDELKSKMGAQTSHQSSDVPQAEEALRGFARDGCKLVFAHGHEFGDAAKRVGEEYKDTIFVVSSGEVKADNVASLTFNLGEAAYLAGMVAASLSKSGKAGQIGGDTVPAVSQAFKLFEKGGKAINSKFSATTTYLGSWSDAGKAKEQALSMYRSGADIIFQNCDAAGKGVFEAAKENNDKGALVIGSNANQNELEPEVIAASAVIDVPKTFLAVAQDVKDGKFAGKVYSEDLKSGNIYLAINPAFKSKIPDDVQKKVDAAKQDIIDGKLKLTG